MADFSRPAVSEHTAAFLGAVEDATNGKCLADKRNDESVVCFLTKHCLPYFNMEKERSVSFDWVGESIFLYPYPTPYSVFPLTFDRFGIYILPGFFEVVYTPRPAPKDEDI